MKLVIGLTGMSGAGKNTVAAVFASLGATVVDCDAIARKALADSDVKASLTETFGDGILTETGDVHRGRLAALAFADEASTQKLNNMTHPYILEETKRQVEAVSAVAVIDAPLLFQSGLDRLCQTTVAVISDRETRFSRILARDGLTREAAEARLSAQTGMDDLLFQADVTIENGSGVTEDELKAVAAMVYTNILSHTERE